MKSGRLKTGKAFSFAMVVSCLSFAVITPHRTIETAAAKTAAEERAAQIESALFTRAEFFGPQAIIPYPTGEARAAGRGQKAISAGFRNRVEAGRT